MTYGHELTFGALLEPPADQAQDILLLADAVEEAGLDVVSLSDHPYWPERLDTLTLLAAIAQRTRRVTVMSNLANLPLRPPPVLARSAATLDILSGGRFELGVAGGAQQLWPAIVADGGPQRSAGQSIDALIEAVRIIRLLWTSEDEVTFEGSHYQVSGARPGPKPSRHTDIWLGAYQPRMLQVTGEMADGWVVSSPYLPPDYLPAAMQVIDEAAFAAGRHPKDIVRAYNIEGSFTPGSGFLQGTPSLWAEQLAEVSLAHGISRFLLYRADSTDVIRRFAQEVVPEVRTLMAAEHRTDPHAA